PGPSPLNRPHPPHSPTHRDFTALRLIRDASSLRVVPCFRWSFPLGMPSSTTPGSASAACAQFLRRRRWPSSSPNDSALPSSPTIRFKWASHFGATSVRIATACRVACLPGGSDRDCSTQPTETFTSGLSTGRSPFPPPDITTVPTGRVAPAGLPPAGMSASIAARRVGQWRGAATSPTFPSSPLKFRTAGFPRYGFKAGVSGGAFPRGAISSHPAVCLLPSHSLWRHRAPRTESGRCAGSSAAVRAARAALPQGPSLRSGLCCPGPSPLNRPHPPHSPTHRDFTALRLIRDASSLRVVPCFRWSFPLGMPSSTTPGSASAACAQFLRRRRWPSSSPNDSALPSSPTIRFKWASHFGATSVRIATACRVACLPGGSDRDCSTQPTETFTSGLSTGRSPFPPPDITTVPTGRVAPAGLPPAGMSASIAALGEGEEVGLVDRVQDLDDGALDDLVFERGNTERPLPPV